MRQTFHTINCALPPKHTGRCVTDREMSSSTYAPKIEVAKKQANDRAVYFIEHLTSAERKEFPIATGVLDYFPDALALVARVSKLGNDKHNPGQPLHWAREKSTDQPDTLLRHMSTRHEYEEIELPDGRRVRISHKAMVAWRALAQLQEEAETQFEAARAAGLRYRPGLPPEVPPATTP